MNDITFSINMTYDPSQSHGDYLPPEMWATVSVCSVDEAQQVCAAVPKSCPHRGELLELLFDLFSYGYGVNRVVDTAEKLVKWIGRDDE